MMKQVKGTGQKQYQSSHKGVVQLVLHKQDQASKSEKPFLLDILTQISELKIAKDVEKGDHVMKTYLEI